MPEVQSKGLVCIYNSGFKVPGMEILKAFGLFWNSLPLRIAVTHFCVEETSSKGNHPGFIDRLLCFVLKFLPQHSRVRSPLHQGSSMEIQYALRSHGITMDTFPLDVNGNVREDILDAWFYKHLQETNQPVPFFATQIAIRAGLSRGLNLPNQLLSYGNGHGLENTFLEHGVQIPNQASSKGQSASIDLESATGDEIGEIQPTEIDVLFGRGYRLQWHTGNVRFRKFLEQNRAQFLNLNSGLKKREISLQLAQMLRNDGVRFLQKNASGRWVESDMDEVDRKIGQFFRELRKKENKNRNRP